MWMMRVGYIFLGAIIEGFCGNGPMSLDTLGLELSCWEEQMYLGPGLRRISSQVC